MRRKRYILSDLEKKFLGIAVYEHIQIRVSEFIKRKNINAIKRLMRN